MSFEIKYQNKTILCVDSSEQDFVVNYVSKWAFVNVKNIKKIHISSSSVHFTPENVNVQSWMLCFVLFFFNLSLQADFSWSAGNDLEKQSSLQSTSCESPAQIQTKVLRETREKSGYALSGKEG